MASAVATPTTPKVTTSVDPLYAQAIAQAQAALKAQIAPIQGEQAASDASFAQRATDATGNASALSELLKGIAPATQGIYANAEQNQEVAGNGYSQGMQDALKGNADNLNSFLDSIHSPAAIDPHAKAAGDVLYGLGGYIPGETFNKEGAAFSAAAAQLPATALLRGQENVKDINVKALAADVGFQNKIAELAGKLPGDVETNYMKLQSLALQNKRFALAVQNQKFTQAAKIASQKLAVAKYNTGIDEFNARQSLSVQRLNMEATRMARAQYNADRNYKMSLARLGISQAGLQLRITAAAYKQAHGGFTQQQITKFGEQANAMANAAYHGTASSKTSASSTTGTSSRSSNTSTNSVSGAGTPYNQALGTMMKKGIPVQVALDALDRVYPPNLQPNPAALAVLLGPLAPAAIAAKAASLNDQGAAAISGAARYGFNPAHAGGFLQAGAPVTMGRADQGRDIQTTPGAPIIAPGDGVVVRVLSDPGGGGGHFGPSYPVVHFTSGPYAGRTIYVGHTVSALKQGQQFTAGMAISHTQPSGASNGGAPSGWAEIGFADGGAPGPFGQKTPF